MATLVCPECGAEVTSPEGWAKSTLATLVPSPAVPGMATRLRCAHCQALFSQLPGVDAAGWRGLIPAAALLATLLAVALLA